MRKIILILVILINSCFYSVVFAKDTKMKAVLVVSAIDGENGQWTQKEIANSEALATVLEENNVEVVRFYTPNDDWGNIVQESKNAEIFSFRGHGSSTGGITLTKEKISQGKLAELKLKKDAIVLIYACYAAGSSFDDLDSGITANDAYLRVNNFSYNFVKNGVSSYYSDWYSAAFPQFMSDLFAGKTFGEAYKNFNFHEDMFGEYTHTLNKNYFVWIDGYNLNGINVYDHAFVGKPNLKLENLFNSYNVYIPLIED